ncbi:hypothetical protein PG1C_08370 [Rugosibacter aromaticivorans]|uniref:Uncharacterized protein n=1 Tax=Rugosibacter aromaticivorans TaxID=1565605 RepID=A0A0C5JM58_9PROT|nr:hypothetical protein PG1C_08370 [Rugosibacter aromaticivorans]
MWSGGADVVVDIQPIRRVTNADYFRTKFVKHLGGNVIRRAMRAIDHNLHAAQIEIVGKGALAKFNIAPRRIIHATRLAQPRRFHAAHGLLKLGFNRQFYGVRQFGALRGKKLDAVIVIRIMRGGNNHSRLQAQCAREISYRRGRHRAAQHDIHSCGSETRFQRRFQHIAGNTCVFADQYRRMFNRMGIIRG